MNIVFATRTKLELLGFDPGIDSGVTMILCGIIALLLFAGGAAAALLLARYIPFLSHSAAPRQGPPVAPQPTHQTGPVPAGSPPDHVSAANSPPAGAPTALSDPRPVPAATVAADHDAVDMLIAQRAALIDGCVKVRGLLDDDIAADALNDAMRRGGVTTFDATGMPVDPKRHRVDGTMPAPSQQTDGIVAETLAPGYLDQGRVLRPADVVVYKWSPR